MKDKKSYYAIIPADVRYDSNLQPNAKLLYGEITALTNEKGFCWANNQYFATLYGVEKETISRWVSSLQDNGYIHIEIDVKGGNSRKIYIDNKDNTPIDNKINTSCEKSQDLLIKKSIPIDKKVKHTYNTKNNTKENNKDNIVATSKEVTPNQTNELFFQNLKTDTNKAITCLSEEFRNQISSLSDTEKKRVWQDFQNFFDHWTEPNKSGSKVKWQMEKTFDVNRRLKKWLSNSIKWDKTKSKGKEIIGL